MIVRKCSDCHAKKLELTVRQADIYTNIYTNMYTYMYIYTKTDGYPVAELSAVLATMKRASGLAPITRST